MLRKGEGKNINPNVLNVGGYILDKYTKNYVEDAFNCKMYNVYGSAESGGDIAFECMHGNLHINYDYYHVETIDQDMKICNEGEQGQIVLTRLFGKATPFVRYTGLNDWITLENNHTCECGLTTPIIKYGIEGRANTSVILPDGRVFPSAAFDHVSTVLNDLNTHKIRQFQIIQKKIDVIIINLVVDDKIRKEKPTIEEIKKEIKNNYKKLLGQDIEIIIKEVDEIKSMPNKPSPLVIPLKK
jgi:phenylacetate-CoA ligase